MKTCQIMNNMVFFVLPETTMDECKAHYNIEQLKKEHGIDFVECSDDRVKQQWTYDKTTNTFSPPIPPEGWGYNLETGVFYELNPPATYEPIDEEKAEMARLIIQMEDK